MKISIVRFILFFLFSTTTIPGAQAQFFSTIASWFGGGDGGIGSLIGDLIADVKNVFTGAINGANNFFGNAGTATSGTMNDITTTTATVIEEVVVVAKKAVGIPADKNSGPFCNRALKGLLRVLQGRFGSFLDDISDYDCSCQVVGGFPPRLQVTCKNVEPTCFQDGSVEYCGDVSMDVNVPFDVRKLDPEDFSFSVTVCWDFDDPNYKSMCFDTNTNPSLTKFDTCSLTVGSDEYCGCETCSGEDAGIIVDCTNINLNTDPNGEDLKLDRTPCINVNNIEDIVKYYGQ